MGNERTKKTEDEKFVFENPGGRGHGKAFSVDDPGMFGGLAEDLQVGDYNKEELARQRARAQARRK